MILTKRAYVVTARQGTKPLFATFRFEEARSWVLLFNERNRTGKTCIRPALAKVNYVTNRVVPLN